MIRITSTQQAESLKGILPELVIKRMQEFEGTDDIYDPDIFGYLIWLEPGDDLTQLTDLAQGGLYDLLDNEWLGFEHVELHREVGRDIYEMVVAIDADKTIAVFLEAGPWLDLHLIEVLKAEAAAHSS
ncbi:hypothetical protein HTZ97_07255 [Desulfuromonas acetoxidans]|uniref:Uncharacterized protein n=1 Tax=Desulfuromonas acetoxidans (strain DSM 684 / 11070) TaxID=281689 RepID=Q1K3L8_DESA6|nr:hypothetical protein [Desulfuromonas acetoxidans]EAT16956.1 conserved hypothetical protein [Desulfuromonas acetoxidans DSM 684]MBF0644513.1 hypothetical protein [Desulfuromonas acetoxidans]NVD23960.1 hypothetical protein [Desulfuromonas acetoxidans]NVE16257.1 hypothetical protein [Desulfuromonas acetoxidans]